MYRFERTNNNPVKDCKELKVKLKIKRIKKTKNKLTI